MKESSFQAAPLPGRPAQISTYVAFFITGFGSAAWAPLVPYVKTQAALDEGALGLLLLCMGIGSIIAMPLAGILTARMGVRRIITVGVLAVCGALPLLAALHNLPALAVALAVFGAGLGMIDCAMNIQAVIVERASGRAMMSGFHGFFSIGGMCGAASVSLQLGTGATPLIAILVVISSIILAMMIAFPHLMSVRKADAEAIFAIPHGRVLLMGMLCFVVFLAEGSVLDWSAVVLTEVHGVATAYAGFGYAAFALAMTAGRLMGDWIVQQVGGVKVITLGGLLSAAGFILATMTPVREFALIGYALVGAGCSNIVPVLFSATARQQEMPEHLAIPAVATLGYIGVLAGPAAIGMVSHLTSLTTAFLVLAAMLVGVAACGRFIPAMKG